MKNKGFIIETVLSVLGVSMIIMGALFLPTRTVNCHLEKNKPHDVCQFLIQMAPHSGNTILKYKTPKGVEYQLYNPKFQNNLNKAGQLIKNGYNRLSEIGLNNLIEED